MKAIVQDVYGSADVLEALHRLSGPTRCSCRFMQQESNRVCGTS